MRIDRGFAIRLLEGAKKMGADFAEVYFKSSRSLSVEVKGQAVDAVESAIDFGYSLRVIRDRRLGFFYSTDIREADAVIENAIEASRWTEQDDYLDLPLPAEKLHLDVFDAAVESLSVDEAKNKALLIEKAALDTDSRIKRVRKASASFSSKDVLIVNSKGVDAGYSATASTAQIMVVAEDGSDSQMGWDFDGSRFLDDVIFEDVGRNAARRAIQLLGAGKINAVKTQAILDGSVAAEFLGIFASLLSSENVQKGKSLLAKRLNEDVVSPIISIVDDGCMPRKLGSRPFDDEGVATSKKYLIRDGVLTGYIYNVYTAKKDGVKSTGNAVRAGFSALPAVGPTNLYIAVNPEHIYSGDLFTGVDKGIYITEAMGVHTANPVSGEFSIGISGLWIDNGAVRHPVKEAIISGSILDLFRNIKAAGDDFRFYGNMGAPSLLTGPVDISA
ncbi:MAG: metallopeptidase TldD-related protein [Thermodesulfovibrionales bacterium]